MNEQVMLQARRYLDYASRRYEVASSDFFAVLALEEAVEAYTEGNYGIGAIVVRTSEQTIRCYRDHNRMITGQGIIDHAELRALLRCAEDEDGSAADLTFTREHSALTRALPLGLSVYGTLEPCPMCAIAMTNAGVAQSVSAALDGAPFANADGRYISSGAAMAIGKKAKLQPSVWQDVQARQGLEFALLETNDDELRWFSEHVFLDTREEIDNLVAERGSGARRVARRTYPPER